jgi:hypothetical protein
VPDQLLTVLATGGPWGLVALFVVLVAVGKLIPRATHEDAVRKAEQRAEDYKAAWAASEERGRVRDQQVDSMLEGYRSMENILRSLDQASRSAGGKAAA